MALMTGWALPVWLFVITAVVAAIVVYRRRTRSNLTGVPIAHRERLTALPAWRSGLRRYRLLVGGFVLCLTAALIGAALLTARPATISLQRPDLNNRDIVLCLDVSGSMVDYDAEVLDVFQGLAKDFTGERLSLVVFNASAVTYFPLTSDYDYVSRQLDRLNTQFDDPDAPYLSGTLIGNGSSLIGDGLASCVVRFDRAQTQRSRSVILVTDNFTAGEEIFTLPQAARLAADRGVRVYGINPGDSSSKDYLADLAQKFRAAIVDTGGAYYALDDPGAIPAVVESITSEQASVLPGAPRVQYTEQPMLGFALALAGFLGIAGFGWRLRR